MAFNTQVLVNGQLGLLSSRQNMAGGGAYFLVSNPTIGTAIAAATVTAFSATANGLFVIQNPGTKTVYLDYLSLIMSGTAPASTTVMRFDYWNETGIVTGTGNVATRAAVSVNAGATTNTVVQSFAAGQITIPAAVGTRKLLGTSAIPTSLGITGDNYVVQFGSDGTPAGSVGLAVVRATVPARLVTDAPPLLVPPNSTTWINMFWLGSATNVPNFEFVLTWSEL